MYVIYKSLLKEKTERKIKVKQLLFSLSGQVCLPLICKEDGQYLEKCFLSIEGIYY